jgi:hypothetical protein
VSKRGWTVGREKGGYLENRRGCTHSELGEQERLHCEQVKLDRKQKSRLYTYSMLGILYSEHERLDNFFLSVYFHKQ